MNKTGNFMQDVFRELRRVTWPTKQETVKYVISVIIVSVFVAAILGLLDLAFFHVLENYIIKY
ncbi:MAG: preprotein translocase subunit SecE [Candidatus Pacebacteria bacterium]|nr:preprotein translocase subunit SecE [Candidatus Paceibacterota bacterium]